MRQLTLGLIFFSFMSLQAHAGAPADLKLALNWKAEPEFGGFYAAKAHFQKAGLHVKILEGGSGTPTIQMLASGQVDYAVVSGDEVLVSVDRGAKDVVALFAVYQTDPTAIMTHAERNFSSLKDVFDHDGTLLWEAGLPYAQYLKKKYGAFKVQTAPYSGGIGIFLRTPKMSQQCFITSEPIAAEKAGVKVKTFMISDSGYNPYNTVLVTQRSRFEKNPDQVKKMVQAVREGWRDYLKDPSAANAVMAKLNPSMDAATFAKIAKTQASLIETAETKKHGLGHMTEERWQTLSDQLLDIKFIKAKPDVTKVFVNL
jgi:NitT/TauT family transport system substrate-binding protein